MRGGQQRACRYGFRCTRLPQGTCRYYHQPSDMNSLQVQQHRNQQGANSGFTNHTQQRNYSPKYYNQNTHEFSFSKRNFNYHNSSPPNSKHLILNFNEYKESQRERFQERASNDDPFEKILCRDYHLGMECKFGLNCPRKHAFTATEQQLLRRLQFTRHFPFDPRSRLTKFKFIDKEYFTMRNGIQVNFLEFNCEKKILEEVFKYTFPDPQGTYNFYDQKNYHIFFSKDNYDTSYDDMGIYNILEAKTYYVTNSHVGKITGIAQLSNNIFFSTSMSGQLKVWVVQDDQLVCHQQTMEKLHSQFNPQNAQIQLYFVDIREVNGTKIISVGTSDGRLLFFFGNDFNFIQVMLGQQNAKVFKIRYTSRQNVPTALVLTWNQSKTFSSVIEIDLVNFSVRPLIQVPAAEGQFEFLLSICEIVYGYLMVGNVQGILSIYPYPDTTNKIGAIFHQNHIADIVCLQSDFQNTKMKMIFVLEKMIGEREGSLGIYVMK